MKKTAKIRKITTTKMPLWNEKVARELLGAEEDEVLLIPLSLMEKWQRRAFALGTDVDELGENVAVVPIESELSIAIGGSDIPDNELNELIAEATGEFEARNLDGLREDIREEGQVIMVTLNGDSDGVQELQEFLML